MDTQNISKAIGVDDATIKALMSGRVSINISGEFGASKAALQDFIQGRVRESVSIILGFSRNEAQQIRDKLNQEQAINLILDHCLKKNSVFNKN